MSELGRKGGRISGENRRARAEAKTDPKLRRQAILDKAVDRLYDRLDKDPDLLGKLALGNSPLLSRILALRDEEQERKARTLIVIENPFAAARPPHQIVERWLGLLREGDLELLQAELQVHAEPPGDS